MVKTGWEPFLINKAPPSTDAVLLYITTLDISELEKSQHEIPPPLFDEFPAITTFVKVGVEANHLIPPPSLLDWLFLISVFTILGDELNIESPPPPSLEEFPEINL